MMTQSLFLEPTDTAQWLQLVRDAETEYGQLLDEDMESYLVYMLMRQSKNCSLAQAALALDYLRTADFAGSHRDNKLRDIGDQCLIVSGLFPRRAAKRNVRVSYYVEMGQSAYHYLSHSLQHATGDLYRHLSETFIVLMDILQTIRSFNSPVLQPIQSFELWSDTGSRSCYQRLAQHGTPVHESLVDIDIKQ